MKIAHGVTAHRDNGDVRRRARLILPALGVVLCAGALIACSSSSTFTGTPSAAAPPAATSAAAPSSVTPTSTVSGGDSAGDQQLCQSRDRLKASIGELTNPALLTGGADEIKTALAQVQADLQGLVAAGQQAYGPQIDALQSSLTSVQTAVVQLGNGGGAENLLAVGSAVTATGSAASELFTALAAACGA